jgi:hypothetical protein
LSSVARPSVVRTRLFALVSVVLFAVMTMVAAQLVTDGPVTSQPPLRAQQAALHSQQAALKEAAAAMASTIVRPITPPPAPAPTTTTTTTVPPAPAPAPAPTPPPTPPPAPPPAPAPAATVAAAPAPTDPGVLPAVGQATAWGCAAALTYLQAYAAKGFTLECPGYAEGREAMTCMNQPGACSGTSEIAIADPCPQAYMNEASNSFVITGVAVAPIDPFGPCP